MDIRLRYSGIRASFPLEQGAKGEVLDDGKFRQDLCVVHLHHPLAGVSQCQRMYVSEPHLPC